MKEDILKLRKEGLSYRDISKRVGCSTSTVSYHCGKGQKEKARERQVKNRGKANLHKRVNKFKSKKSKRLLQVKSRDFQRSRTLTGYHTDIDNTFTFNLSDVLSYIGDNPTCYLTGRAIDLSDTRSYHFDHIIPVSKGGSNCLENLGIACREANKAKDSLLVGDFISLCKEVLENNGYTVDTAKVAK